MTIEDKQTKSLYLAAWDDLNRIVTDVRIADDAGDVDTVRNGLCAASIFIEDLTPYVEKIQVSDQRRSGTLDLMSKVIESGSPSDILNRMDELLDVFNENHDFFPSSLEEDESTVVTIRELATKSAGACRYIHRYRTPLEVFYAQQD